MELFSSDKDNHHLHHQQQQQQKQLAVSYARNEQQMRDDGQRMVANFDWDQTGGAHQQPGEQDREQAQFVRQEQQQPQPQQQQQHLQQQQQHNDADRPKRNPACSRCRNHGKRAQVKGHKRHCAYKDCQCDGCKLVEARQIVSALQIKRRRYQKQDEECGRRIEVSPPVLTRSASNDPVSMIAKSLSGSKSSATLSNGGGASGCGGGRAGASSSQTRQLLTSALVDSHSPRSTASTVSAAAASAAPSLSGYQMLNLPTSFHSAAATLAAAAAAAAATPGGELCVSSQKRLYPWDDLGGDAGARRAKLEPGEALVGPSFSEPGALGASNSSPGLNDATMHLFHQFPSSFFSAAFSAAAAAANNNGNNANNNNNNNNYSPATAAAAAAAAANLLMSHPQAALLMASNGAMAAAAAAAASGHSYPAGPMSPAELPDVRDQLGLVEDLHQSYGPLAVYAWLREEQFNQAKVRHLINMARASFDDLLQVNGHSPLDLTSPIVDR